MKDASALFRLLGDEVRLRLLRLLAAERLNVTELTGILGIAQSGVSRHLGMLRDNGLIEERREGGYTYYQVAPPESRNGQAALWALLEAQFVASAHDPAARADQARLKEVLRLRKESFATHGEGQQLVPGRSWAAWARALAFLLPASDVADLGCGDGYSTIEAARWARRVVAVDRSDEVLKRARALARRRKRRQHHLEEGRAGTPAAEGRLGGRRAAVAGAAPRGRSGACPRPKPRASFGPADGCWCSTSGATRKRWVRERFGDRWLGFEDDELAGLLKESGFADVRVKVGARLTGDPFTVLVASGTRPAAGRSTGAAAS